MSRGGGPGARRRSGIKATLLKQLNERLSIRNPKVRKALQKKKR